MNTKQISDRIGNIDDRLVHQAEHIPNYSQRRPARRVLAGVLVAAAVLVCTMMAALAVSPELRQAIISLFQLDEAEQVPGIPAGVNEVRTVTIGDTVTAQYVKVEGNWDWVVDGALLRSGSWAGDGSRFYELDGEALVEIGADAPVASAQVSRNGQNYAAMFRWFVYDGILYTDELAAGSLFDGVANYVLTPARLGNRTDVAVLTSNCPVDNGDIWESYSWIYDLDSGEVRDVLADCGVESLGSVIEAQFAGDLKHAIVRAADGGVPYLADLDKKTLTPLNELFGAEIKAGQLQVPRVVGTVQFAGSDTILLTTDEGAVWTYRIPSGAVVCTAEDAAGLQRINSWRGTLGLSVEETGVSIVDLATGGRIRLEGVDGRDTVTCIANSTDTKLVWAQWDDDNVLSRLGVIDLENGEFTAFDREHQEELRGEWLYWLGDNRVMSVTDLHRGEGFDPERSPEYYLCVYTF